MQGEDGTTGLPSTPPLSWKTRLLYASGAAANAIKQRGLSLFLLIFYNQVVGLPAAMVASAIMIALIFDAFMDPTIGHVSDNFRSRWGRRHPFMYAAALPVSVAFCLIWNPPQGWSDGAIFAYMLSCLLVIRFFDTFFELPSMALLPELTIDYDERTKLFALRSFFGTCGGLLMTLLAYQVFLKENPDGSGGVLARDGYLGYSLAAAAIIFTIILVSTTGTHSRIPYLSKAPSRKITVMASLREVKATLGNVSFVVLAVAGMSIAVASGVKGSMELYFMLYLWGFDQDQLSLLAVAGIICTFLGVSLASPVAKRLGKKRAAIIMFSGAVITGLGPLFLRAMGLMPANGTDLLFWVLFVNTVINDGMGVIVGIMLSAMIADVVEDAQVRTGRRSEGLLNSADNLFKKIVSGVGVFVAGTILTIVHFPKGAKRGEVDPELMRDLALMYVPTNLGFYIIAFGLLFFYRIDRGKHEDNLRRLRDRELGDEAVEARIAGAAP